MSSTNVMKLLRERVGMTQGALAERSGIPQTTLSAYERSRSGVPVEAARRLAGPLGVDAGDLRFGTQLAALKARGESTTDPRVALFAASAAFDLAEDESLSQAQRDLAAQLCMDLLRSVEEALGYDGKDVQEELAVAAKSVAENAPRGVERDERGVPVDPHADLRRLGWK